MPAGKFVAKKITLRNGLRVISVPIENILSTAVIAMMNVGSCYENSNKGISHLLEHVALKGTKNWPTQRDLSLSIESMGGILNGWTGKEITIFWIKIPRTKSYDCLKVLLDIIFFPKLTPKSINKEKDVIVQEINRQRDSLDYCLWNLIRKTMWQNHPLGRNVLGDKASVNKINRNDLVKYKNIFYTPENTIIIIAGNVNVKKIISAPQRIKKTSFSKPSLFASHPKKNTKQPHINQVVKNTKQTRLALGVETFQANHPDRFVLSVINSLLGIGLGSRLTQRIRAKKGLVYSIRSSISQFKNTGSFIVTTGFKHDHVNLVIEEITKELKRLKTQLVENDELKTAKEKAIGRFLFQIEAPEKIAEWYGIQEIHQSNIPNPNAVIKNINAVTPKDIKRVAKNLFTVKKLNLSIIGPTRNDKRKLFHLLKLLN
jgi:predicted Zn-dependent peptidase